MQDNIGSWPRRGRSAPRSLAQLRAQIDRIDDRILAAIEKRLALADDIAKFKRIGIDDPLPLRPVREQTVLRRIGSRRRRVPARSIDLIWRELMGMSVQAQAQVEFVVCATHRPISVSSVARARLGFAAPMTATQSPVEAVSLARTRHAVAIIELSPLSDWWTGLADDPNLRIFDHLEDDDGRPLALLIGRVSEAGTSTGWHATILDERALRQRQAETDVRVLALSGRLRLCLVKADRHAAECAA